MRKVLVAALGCWMVGTLVSGCHFGSGDKILSKDTMKVVLTDMLKADALNEFRAMRDTNYRHDTAYALLYANIFGSHHITRQQFADSYNYYLSRPEDLKALVDSMASDASRTANTGAGKGNMAPLQGANRGAGRPGFVPPAGQPGGPAGRQGMPPNPPGARPGFPANAPGNRPGFPPNAPGARPGGNRPGFPPGGRPGTPGNRPGVPPGGRPGGANLPGHPAPSNLPGHPAPSKLPGHPASSNVPGHPNPPSGKPAYPAPPAAGVAPQSTHQ